MSLVEHKYLYAYVYHINIDLSKCRTTRMYAMYAGNIVLWKLNILEQSINSTSL